MPWQMLKGHFIQELLKLVSSVSLHSQTSLPPITLQANRLTLPQDTMLQELHQLRKPGKRQWLMFLSPAAEAKTLAE